MEQGDIDTFISEVISGKGDILEKKVARHVSFNFDTEVAASEWREEATLAHLLRLRQRHSAKESDGNIFMCSSEAISSEGDRLSGSDRKTSEQVPGTPPDGVGSHASHCLIRGRIHKP